MSQPSGVNTILIRPKWPNFDVFGQLAFRPGKNYEVRLEFPPAVAKLHQTMRASRGAFAALFSLFAEGARAATIWSYA